MDTGQSPEAEFREALKSYPRYPDGESLSTYSFPVDETPDKVEGYARHFRENAPKLFSTTKGRNITCVPIRDYRAGSDGLAYAIKFYTIRLLEDLHNQEWMACPADLEDGATGFQPDPLCRIILLERQGWLNQLMNVEKDILHLMLTYHQVHPCYLNFLTCCGTKSVTGASDVGFSGFRGYVSPAAAGGDECGARIKGLDRSGQLYQLCLKFESFRRDRAASTANIPGKPEPSVFKPMAAAIYHQFDVGTGTSLWIISNPLENITPSSAKTLTKGRRVNLLWEDVQGRMAEKDYRVVDGNPGTRFGASLDVVHLLSEWSVGDMDYHLNHLDITFDGIAQKYIHGLARVDSDGPILEDEDLRIMSKTLLDIQVCRIATEDNMRVLKHLGKFYTNLPGSLEPFNLAWHEDVKTGVAAFKEGLGLVIARTESILERIEVLERLTGSRADSIQKHIENATNKAMKKLTAVTSDDSSAMRVFAFITLVLLPVTVVSTVMSTNMVHFNDIPDRSGGEGNVGGNSTADHTEKPPYDFSWLMFKTWITASLVLTAVCIAFSWTWTKVARQKREKGKSLRALIFPPRTRKQQPPHPPLDDIEGLRLVSNHTSQDDSDSSVLTVIGLACSGKWAELAALRRKKGGLRALIFPRGTKRESHLRRSILGSRPTGDNVSPSGADTGDRNGKQPRPSVTGAPGFGTTQSITDRRGNDAPPRLSTAPVPGMSPALDSSSTAVGWPASLQSQRGGGHVRSGSSVSRYSSQPFSTEGHGGGGQDSPA